MEEISPNVKSVTGFTLGIGYNLPLTSFGNSMLSLQPEIDFIQKGFKSTLSGTFNEGDYYYTLSSEEKYTVNYLEIPVIAKLSFGPQNTRFHIMAGPSLAYGLGGKYKATFTFDDGESYSESYSGKIKFGEEPEENEEDAYINNRVDFGVQLGVGVTFMEKITVDLRYGLGLSDLSDDFASKNRVLQFSVSMPLSLR